MKRLLLNVLVSLVVVLPAAAAVEIRLALGSGYALYALSSWVRCRGNRDRRGAGSAFALRNVLSSACRACLRRAAVTRRNLLSLLAFVMLA
jgi:hypothetical protein